LDRPLVLVVDDEPANRALFKATLADFCEVVEAENGPAALEIFARQAIDLVLLDVMMPLMDGYEVCRKLKDQAKTFVPVLLVTALGEQSDRNRGLEAGADDFLTKPVDRRELLLRTRAFLRLRGQERIIRRQLEDLARLQTAKDDLVALLVHDLRSPLSGVVAHLQLLQEELTGRAAVDAQQALRSADTALGRLEEALQIRLLEEDSVPVRRESVALAAIVDETISTLGSIARKKNIRFTGTTEGEPMASIDGKLLRRSLENLLTNALKYTPSGGDVSVAVRRDGSAVRIAVSDRGPGIPDDLKQTMFEKFGSVEVKRGGARKGYGLGLYLVKLVAQGHGGSVSVEDRPGGGTIFRMTLGAA
jgi:signal transduction histidine kinase